MVASVYLVSILIQFCVSRLLYTLAFHSKIEKNTEMRKKKILPFTSNTAVISDSK